ncbi:MAG: selenocysteine-specific translation factor, partial [Thiobacillus sp.]|nr:selenocysteine-specific translation factor [Thiobacillus sp.]
IADPAGRLAALLDAAPWGLDLARLAIAWNRPDLAGLLPGSAIVAAGSALAFTETRWQALGERLLAGLAEYHERCPDELGPDAGRARRMLLLRLAVPAFTALVYRLLAEDRLRRSGPWLHRPEHRIRLGDQERALAERILPWLGEAPHDPPWVRDLARRAGVEEARMRMLMRKLAGQGEVYQVVRDLFYTPAALANLADAVRELEERDGEARAASFRDRTGIGRKRCIQILEFFDRVGYTRRVGESHRLRNPAMFTPEATCLN